MQKEIKNSNTKLRESNIELLRIVAMIMIVAHHFSVHGNFELSKTLFLNNIWLQFLSSGGKIGVNVFVMISGYFLISSKDISTKKILKLLMQILFYSITIFLVFVCFGLAPFNKSNLLDYILGYPVWWFVKSYLILYLLHPYINKCINNLNKEEFKRLILLLTLLLSLIPTVLNRSFEDGTLAWFINLYLIGGYLKKFPVKLKCNSNIYGIIFLSLYTLTFLTVIFFDLKGTQNNIIIHDPMYFFRMEKLPTLMISIFMFLAFLNLKIKSSKIINIVSSSTLGVYLLHDNSYTRTFLWREMFKNASYQNTYMLIPYSLVVILVVFIACSLIELLRIYLIEKKYMPFVEKISKFIDKWINRVMNLKVLSKI